MTKINTYRGDVYYIEVRDGELFASGYLGGKQQYQTIGTAEVFDTEEEYRERFKELTGEYPQDE